MSAVAAGDTLTLTFDQGTPEFEVTPQVGVHFLQDPSGRPVYLSGSAGATIVLRGFRDDMLNLNYTSPVSMPSSGPLLLQVYELGDHGGVVTWAVGLSTPGCGKVTAAGSTLTFRFMAIGGGTLQTPSSAAQASPSRSPLACTASGPASGSWPAPWLRTSTTPPILSAVAAGDTLTLTFDQGTPEFEVGPLASTHVSQDPSGRPVYLSGSAAAVIVVRGFRGDMLNFTGPVTMPSSGPLLLQVYELGDFEGVASWAVGLSKPGCANVTAAGSTLTFWFIASPA